MTTRNNHAHAHAACNAQCRPAVAPRNAPATQSAPFSRNAAQPKPAQNSPRAAQTPRAPFGGAASPAGAPRAGANAAARTQPPHAPQGATAQRRAALQSPSRGGFSLQPPSPLGGGRQQIKVTVAGTKQVAGSVDIRPTGGGKAYISNLKVEHDFRRQGLANQLMNAALRSARGQGFNSAQLEARPSDSGITSQALVSMYQKMGFRNVGKSHRGNPLMERRL